MGAVLRKPVAANEWDSIYREGLRLEMEFIKTMNVSKKRMIFSQWFSIKCWGDMLIAKMNFKDSEEKRIALDKIHDSMLKHNIGFLYTIDESFLQIPLLGSS